MKSSFIFLLGLAMLSSPLLAQTSLFNFQGALADANGPANGIFDMEFKLFDDLSGDNQVGATQPVTVPVTDGFFSIDLDFGSAVWNGDDRYLELAVRPEGSAEPPQILAPREKILSVPYALKALSATHADSLSSGTPLDLSGPVNVGPNLGGNSFLEMGGTGRGLLWDDGASRFEFDDSLGFSGVLNAGSSGKQFSEPYNFFASGQPTPDSNDITTSGDLYINRDLEVDQTIYADGGFLAKSPSTITSAGNTPQLSLLQTTKDNFARLELATANGGWHLSAEDSSEGDLRFWNGSINRMILEDNGDLSLDGALSAGKQVQVGENLYLGTESVSNAGDQDSIFFQYRFEDVGGGRPVLRSESLSWDNSETRFEFSNRLGVGGVLNAGSGGGEAPTAYNYFSSGTPTPDSGDMTTSGDLYVNRDLEVDQTVYADGGLRSRSNVSVFSGSEETITLDAVNASGAGEVVVRKGDGSLGGFFSGATSSGSAEIRLYRSNPGSGVILSGQDGAGGGSLTLRNSAGSSRVRISGGDTSGSLDLINAAGQTTLTLTAENGPGNPSRVKTGTLEITGGSDLSEQFEISNNIHDQQPEPGMIVCIDPKNPGHLVPSSTAYDRTVAGIISGAGGVRPGLLMGQRDSLADGAHPVALTGRVYCYVDANRGAIEPGDLLTTSDTPGHGMKVQNHDHARGAIIGKAMTGLHEGTGLVLVLVSLQ